MSAPGKSSSGGSSQPQSGQPQTLPVTPGQTDPSAGFWNSVLGGGTPNQSATTQTAQNLSTPQTPSTSTNPQDLLQNYQSTMSGTQGMSDHVWSNEQQAAWDQRKAQPAITAETSSLSPQDLYNQYSSVVFGAPSNTQPPQQPTLGINQAGGVPGIATPGLDLNDYRNQMPQKSWSLVTSPMVVPPGAPSLQDILQNQGPGNLGGPIGIAQPKKGMLNIDYSQGLPPGFVPPTFGGPTLNPSVPRPMPQPMPQPAPRPQQPMQTRTAPRPAPVPKQTYRPGTARPVVRQPVQPPLLNPRPVRGTR